MDLLIILILLAIVLPTAYAAVIGAPLAGTNKETVEEIVKTADLKTGDVFYELGTGTGRIITAFSENEKIKCVGFELSPLYWFITFLNLKLKNRKNYKLYCKNFFKADLGEANAVFFFLMPRVMERVKEKFLSGLKPKTKIISYAFEIKGWEPYAVIKKPGKLSVYFYFTPEA
ncbi:MAG: hypothetical protein WC461_00885 [Candidatus Paceibacterota bacterium]